MIEIYGFAVFFIILITTLIVALVILYNKFEKNIDYLRQSNDKYFQEEKKHDILNEIEELTKFNAKVNGYLDIVESRLTKLENPKQEDLNKLEV
jgi:methionine synthase II (cobalamin-independent)